MSESQSSIPAWNQQMALENTDGCVSDLKELLEIWLRQTPQLVSNLKQGLADLNTEVVHLAAHTIKGSLQILGAEIATSVAETLETAARNEKLAEGSTLLKQLEHELQTLTAQITTYVNTD